MFASLKHEFSRRSVQIGGVWRLIDRLEAEEIAQHVIEPGLRSLKGLMFVHLYSAYEFTVINSFGAVVRSFNGYAISLQNTKRTLLARLGGFGHL